MSRTVSSKKTDSLEFDPKYYDDLRLNFDSQKSDLDDAVNSYVRIMTDVKKLAVISGDLSLAIEGFNIMAGRVSGELKQIITNASKQVNGYAAEVEAADHYIF